jgi:isopenicillin N synthase-like dioxygenase
MEDASSTSFPIVDISRIDDPQSQLQLAQEITSACQQWGFLLLKGHPIPPSHVDELFSLGKEFFALPEDQKAPYPITSQTIGYVGSFQDRGKDDKMSMWFGGPPGTLDDNTAMLPPFWHDHTRRVEEFKHQCHALIIKLLECFALALDLPDRDFFATAHEETASQDNSLRMILYPARPEMPAFEGLGSRMAEHTDSGSVTLLFQRSAGLEVLSPSGRWVRAPHIQDCILVNLGDTLSFWSSGRLKATLHRVTFDTLSHNQERQTMAYFGKASPDTVLQPIFGQGESDKYFTNGVELRPGMTVRELSTTIMRNIYGAAFQSAEKQAERANVTASMNRQAVAV